VQQPVFFLDGPAPGFLFQTKLTNLLVEDDQLVGELLQAMELGDLLLGFAQGGGAGETLIDRLTLNFASEAELRVMSGVMRTGTMTGRFATETPGRGNRAGAEISQAKELLQQSGTLGF
jgi:hypothetical protein